MCLTLETLTSIVRTGSHILVELVDLVKSVISNDLTQMVNFHTRIQDCIRIFEAFDLFISSDASICSTMTFPPLGNFDHVVVSVSIDFPLNSKWNVQFHCIVYGYSCADWDGLRDDLRNVP